MMDFQKGMIWCGVFFSALSVRAQSIQFGGDVDFFLQTGPQSVETAPGSRQLPGRIFDARINRFILNWASLQATLKKESLQTQIEIAGGEALDGLTPNLAGPGGDPGRFITQATLTYAPSGWRGASLSAGKFFTPLGFETVKAKDNWQYSRSLGFNYAIPFWHQGVTLGVPLWPERLKMNLSVVNGWDGRIAADNNQHFSAILSVNATPNTDFTVNLNVMTGPESAADSVRDVQELNVSYRLNEDWSFAVDGMTGTQTNAVADDRARWSSLAFYARLLVAETWALSARLEEFDDSDQGFALSGGLGGAGLKQKITAATLASRWDLGEGLETRLELRQDRSDSDAFFRDAQGEKASTQASATWALLHRF
ncbi:MAG: outer membrane beta-barrel protein [Bdellovibrionaceae bacterium]|nr:outer membrane beta-barrel protein [Pseudobdellovibrionaceae bacterium]MBX3033521.1 outer membrane beta-barrel protein [Pseudobdellovibrionaceae bacterium]